MPSSEVVAQTSTKPRPSTFPASGPSRAIPTVRIRRYSATIARLPTIKSVRVGQRERGVEKLGRGGHEEEGTVAPPLLEVLGGYPQVYEPGDERRGRVQARPAAIGGEASHADILAPSPWALLP